MTNGKKKGKSKADNVRLIEQALNGAEASIVMAKRFLKDLRQGDPSQSSSGSTDQVEAGPGVEGTFDGQFMVTKDGTKHQVSENYASKSVLVHGDHLRMVGEAGSARFKQIRRVRRKKVDGILVKKGGKWAAVTADGSYSVLPAAAAYFEVREGDEACLVLPEDNQNVPFAAVESVTRQKSEEVASKKSGKREEPKSKPATKAAPKSKAGVKRSSTRKDGKRAAKESKPVEAPAPEIKGEVVIGEDELR